MDTKVNYMGLELEHPVVVGASPLTMDAPSIQECAKAGAAAVVMKSLFEEQVRKDTAILSQSLLKEENMHTEVFDYLQAQVGMRYGTLDYLENIRQAKASVNIPIIASLNCVSTENWADMARELEAAGASALELNLGFVSSMKDANGRQVEERLEKIVRCAREAVSLPLAVKLPNHFTCLQEMLQRCAAAGADGLVLFNRFWTPEIDIEDESFSFPTGYSSPQELQPVLRDISLVAGRLRTNICANTGVYSGADVVRALLAGADCVQMVSSPLQYGREKIAETHQELNGWMRKHGYEKISDFRGKLSQVNQPGMDLTSRELYMDWLGTKAEEQT